jgi:hypothetical protein
LEIEQEANFANNEEDLNVTAALEEMEEENDEHAEYTLGHELVADFVPFAEIADDNEKVTKLTTLSSTLKQELIDWKAFRISTINRFRIGAKVAEITHEGEAACLLRFFGYCHTVHDVSQPSMKLLRAHNIGATVEAYVKWLEEKQLMWSSVVTQRFKPWTCTFACC